MIKQEFDELRYDIMCTMETMQKELDDCITKKSRRKARKLSNVLTKKFKEFRKLSLKLDKERIK